MTLRSLKSISIAVGASSLEVAPDGILLKSPVIRVEGSQEVQVRGNGPSLSLAADAEIAADSITILAPHARLNLGEHAELRGNEVKLGRHQPKDKPAADDKSKPTKPFRIRLADADFEPYGDKHYLAVADGARVEGTTDIDGNIDIHIPESSQMVEVTCWIDRYPTGRRKNWTVRIADLHPPTSPRGASQRLHNLGYLDGPARDHLDGEVSAAICWFQKDHELAQTGKLDGPTTAALETLHGH